MGLHSDAAAANLPQLPSELEPKRSVLNLTVFAFFLLQYGCTKDPQSLTIPLSSDQAIIAGIKEPFLTLKYLGFIALAGPYALSVSRRRFDPLGFCVLAFLACLLAFYLGPEPFPLLLPILTFAVALSVIAMLALQWTGNRFVRWSTALILGSGLIQGYEVSSQIPQGSFSSHAAFALSFSLIMGVIAYGIGIPAAKMQAQNPDDYESLENLVTAIVSGIALVYLVWAFKA